jgi:hypothetical protein
VVAVHSQPPRRNSASGACSEQKFSISSIAASDARTSRRASLTPHSVVKLAIFGHHVITKPPQRPDAPPPHTSASMTQTSTAGSRRLIMRAVHRPTNPPPTMATSLVTAPCNWLRSSALPASACSSQNERCMDSPRKVSRTFLNTSVRVTLDTRTLLFNLFDELHPLDCRTNENPLTDDASPLDRKECLLRVTRRAGG